MPTPSSPPTLPRIVVLLATRNGLRWLPEQLDSILGQEGVEVRVVALDDESTDGTRDWLLDQAAKDARLSVLPSQGASGGAAANFYRLLEQCPIEGSELVAFSDQDDVWLPGKLARHAGLIAAGGYDGVSSNVTAFTADGKRRLVRKDFPQRRFDYLLESPGPGSTFLMSHRLAEAARRVLVSNPNPAASIDYHDWLLYAIARASGWKWHIDSTPSVEYRQHAGNAMGANLGVRPGLSRLALIRARWHRNQATRLARISLDVADPVLRPGLERILGLLASHTIRDRLALARLARHLRRRPRDQRIIGFLIATGVW